MNVNVSQCPVLQDVCLSTNSFILSRMILFVDERPKYEKLFRRVWNCPAAGALPRCILYTRKVSDRGKPQSTIMYCRQNIQTARLQVRCPRYSLTITITLFCSLLFCSPLFCLGADTRTLQGVGNLSLSC